MRLTKVFLPFITTIILTLACSMDNLPESTPTAISTETQTVTPRPTHTPFPTPLPDYPKATPVPAWVTDFSEPLLEVVADRRPDFQDDFSLNRGWRNNMPGIGLSLYAERFDGMLFLRLPEGINESILYNSRIDRRNFVLTLDLRFNHSQPEDAVRFQFDQSADESVAFDFSNNRNWKFSWGPRDNWQSMSGIYEHFPPEHIPVTIIMRGAECAIYINGDPLAYVGNCRTSSSTSSHLGPVTFRLLRSTRHDVAVNFDNLKIWDLDKIPDLP